MNGQKQVLAVSMRADTGLPIPKDAFCARAETDLHGFAAQNDSLRIDQMNFQRVCAI
jgi:hypothetical protein